MKKEKEKSAHPKGKGVALCGDPGALLRRMVKAPSEAERIIGSVTDEGPAHKQVFSAWMLLRMNELIGKIEHTTGKAFVLQPGVPVTSAKDGVSLPFPFPEHMEGEGQTSRIAEAAAHAPLHELAAFTALLQAMEWSIGALGDLNQNR